MCHEEAGAHSVKPEQCGRDMNACRGTRHITTLRVYRTTISMGFDLPLDPSLSVTVAERVYFPGANEDVHSMMSKSIAVGFLLLLSAWWQTGCSFTKSSSVLTPALSTLSDRPT